MTRLRRLAPFGFVFALLVWIDPAEPLHAQTPPPDAAPVCNVCDPEAARSPFSVEVIVNISPGQTQLAWPGSEVVGLTVPSGRRYVVQHVSATANFPAGQRFRLNLFAAATSVFFVRHQLLPTRVTTGGSSTDWVASQAMRIDLDPGTELAVELRRYSSSGSGSVLLYVSGYTIPLP